MAKVTVCRYTAYDIVRGESFVAPRWATRDTIARIRGAAAAADPGTGRRLLFAVTTAGTSRRDRLPLPGGRL